jgi:outer membrane protein assembly factor BamB
MLLPLAVSGQSPRILWWHDLDAPSLGSAAVADIDFDGLPEILFGTYWNDERIIALNAEDGSPLWDYPTDSCNDASPVIADVDFDDTLEVIVPASATSMIYCFCGPTGAVEWSTPTGYANCIDSPPTVVEVSVASGMLRLNWCPVIGAVCCRVSAGD